MGLIKKPNLPNTPNAVFFRLLVLWSYFLLKMCYKPRDVIEHCNLRIKMLARVLSRFFTLKGFNREQYLIDRLQI